MSFISIIIPVFNEEESIFPMYEAIQQLHLTKVEIIWVDDGSTDHTFLQLEKLCSSNNLNKCISFSRNFGHQYALLAGMKAAKGEIIIHIDGDLQHPVELIPLMIEKINAGYNIVTTKRKTITETNFLKSLYTKWFYSLVNFLSETPITSNTADFRAFDKKVLQKVTDFGEHHLFWRGIFNWVGFKKYELLYIPGKRKYGKTKYSMRKMFSLARFGILSFSLRPLRLALTLGFIICLFAFTFSIYAIVAYLNGKIVSGWTSIIITSMIIGGVQLLVVGILGEYIGNIYREVLKRPKYLVNETINIPED